MTSTTTSAAGILLPAQVGDLLVKPAFAASIAAQVATIVTISSKSYRIPRVSADPTAGWVAEGAEISVTDPTIDEVDVTPAKLAGLTVVSSELANDSNPAAAEVVGQGLARDIARKLDIAFFGNVSGGVAPAGLGGLGSVGAVSAGSAWTDLDAFTDAALASEALGAQITGWVANKATAAALLELKAGDSLNSALLQSDSTQPSRRVINGAPLYVSPGVADDTVWGIPADRTYLVVRDDASVVADASIFFTSDRIAVRGTMRVGFGFAHPEAIQKVTITP